jgi:two-component system alkaline phosphatase synthesis response regulator PhoP
MTTILIISRDEKETKNMRSTLLEAGFRVSVIEAPSSEVEAVYQEKPDLIVIDIETEDALRLCSVLKKDRLVKDTPIIAMIQSCDPSKADLVSRVDDFVSKPCEPAEVLLRIKSLLWRVNKIDTEHAIKFGDLTIDMVKYEVWVGSRRVSLTFKEFELLRFLATHRERVFSRDALLDRIWGHDYYGGTRTVDVHVRRLRGKIEDGKHKFVETVRNVGYKFK